MDPISFARSRRRVANEFERLMWKLLRNRQRCSQKFRREHPLGTYTADFYCAQARLNIELDGESHRSTEAKRYDAARDRWMNKQGIRVLRFTYKEFENQTQQVLAMIDAALQQGNDKNNREEEGYGKPLTPDPSPRESG